MQRPAACCQPAMTFKKSLQATLKPWSRKQPPQYEAFKQQQQYMWPHWSHTGQRWEGLKLTPSPRHLSRRQAPGEPGGAVETKEGSRAEPFLLHVAVAIFAHSVKKTRGLQYLGSPGYIDETEIGYWVASDGTTGCWKFSWEGWRT